MYGGKLVVARVMTCRSLHKLQRRVARYPGCSSIVMFCQFSQFLANLLAQLTFGESPRYGQAVVSMGVKSRTDYPLPLHRIRFYGGMHSKLLVFFTNHFDLPILAITQLGRWLVEWFFSIGSRNSCGSKSSLVHPKLPSTFESGWPSWSMPWWL